MIISGFAACSVILSKDLVKYLKYLIHCLYLFYVVKGISSNKTINSRLNTIIPTSNVNIKKDADTGHGTNKAVNKVSKPTNFTLSRTTVLKNISHSENVQLPNNISRSLQTSSK